jgi:polypyrimidine tract-binding protein 2
MMFAVGNSLDAQPSRILLVTIVQVLYPMTVYVLRKVFSRYGYVQKIVTFQKSAGQILRFLYLYLSFLMKCFCV